MTAAEHAARADELLTHVEDRARELRDASPELELELVVTGAAGRINADVRFTIELATAHALTAAALSLVPDSDVCPWRA